MRLAAAPLRRDVCRSSAKRCLQPDAIVERHVDRVEVGAAIRPRSPCTAARSTACGCSGTAPRPARRRARASPARPRSATARSSDLLGVAPSPRSDPAPRALAQLAIARCLQLRLVEQAARAVGVVIARGTAPAGSASSPAPAARPCCSMSWNCRSVVSTPSLVSSGPRQFRSSASSPCAKLVGDTARR